MTLDEIFMSVFEYHQNFNLAYHSVWIFLAKKNRAIFHHFFGKWFQMKEEIKTFTPVKTRGQTTNLSTTQEQLGLDYNLVHKFMYGVY